MDEQNQVTRMRIQFRLHDPQPAAPGHRDYDVFTQPAKGARWESRGMVSRYGQPGTEPAWNALGKAADAWTEWFPTHREATREMLDGHTWKSRQAERDQAARYDAEHEREPG